ncbi:MAG: O-antigen ligase family protein [Granulosicoccus sp.]
MLTTYQAAYRAPFLPSALLLATLLQGSSFTLTIGFRGPFVSDLLSSLVTLGWLGMYAMAVIGLISSFGLNWVSWLVRYRLLLTCMIAGAAFSTAWSFDPGLTLERSIHLIGTTLIAIYLGLSLPLHRILKTSAIVLGLLMVASACIAVFLPSLGMQNYEGTLVWAGVLASKNTLGFWSAITLLLLVSLSFWSISNALRLLYLVLAIFSLLCLYKSVSATSLLALITSALVMIYLHAAFSLRLGLTAMLVLGVFVAGLAGVAFHFIDTAELIGRSGDMTGRGEVWLQTWQLILERPLTGFGYGTIWFPTADTVWIQKELTEFTWTVFHAHNGLLQIASELGLPLAALTLFMIIQQLVEIVYCQYQRQQPGVLFVLGFTIALLVSNYTEARLLVNRDLYWIFFIALPISMLQQVNVSAAATTAKVAAGKNRSTGRERFEAKRQRVAYKRLLLRRLYDATSASTDRHAQMPYRSASNQQVRMAPDASSKPVASAASRQNSRANKQTGAAKTVEYGTLKSAAGSVEQERIHLHRQATGKHWLTRWGKRTG